MNRYLGYGSLLLLIGWLVVSYGAWLPTYLQIEAPLARYGDWFQQATLLILFLFISIQLWLLRLTVRILRRRHQFDLHSMPTSLRVSALGEIFWTALPLLLTLGLALVGYKFWVNL